MVWDSYTADSLKAHTRECRGTGHHLRVSDRTHIPRNWRSFLRVDSNKTELFQFLASAAVIPEGKILITTKGECVISSSTLDMSFLQPCTQEEADHRIMLHCAHAHQHGMKRIMVHATDTVLAIVTSRVLEGCEIWLAFGHNKNFRHIAAHTIAAELGDDWCKGLLFMHAISGCDTVSSFAGIGKKTVWDVWRSLPSLTTLFGHLSQTPEAISDHDMEEIERFVVLMYSRTSQLVTVNAARKQLFQSKAGKPSSFKSSSISTCQMCIISSRPHLGTSADSKAIYSKSFRLGLAEGQRWKMGTIMDNPC